MAVREAFKNLGRTACEMGLQVTEGKTKYMDITTRPEGSTMRLNV
jgi:hypothetical protein